MDNIMDKDQHAEYLDSFQALELLRPNKIHVENHKPFTLQWWLIIHGMACSTAIGGYSAGSIKTYNRYLELRDWIQHRIIEKFDN